MIDDGLFKRFIIDTNIIDSIQKTNVTIRNKHFSRGYAPAMVNKLIKIRERAWAYTWLHRESAQQLKNWYDRISYLNIFFQLLVGTSIFVTASVCNNTYYLRYATGIMTIITGFTSGFLKHKEYGQEIMKHKITSSKYSRIYDSIDGQLETPAQAQQEAHHFHNWICNEFDALFSTSPDLDEDVIRLYGQKFRNRKIHPIEAAEFEEITTNTRRKIKRVKNKSTQNKSLDHESSDLTQESSLTINSDRSETSEPPEMISSDEGSDIYEETNPNANTDANPHANTDTKEEAKTEIQLKHLLNQLKNEKMESFNPTLYNYQMNRMSLNTDKCYIDPFTFEYPSPTGPGPIQNASLREFSIPGPIQNASLRELKIPGPGPQESQAHKAHIFETIQKNTHESMPQSSTNHLDPNIHPEYPSDDHIRQV